MAEQVTEDFEDLPRSKYTEPVLINMDGHLIGWHPQSEYLITDSDDQIAEDYAQSIQELIAASNDFGRILVTPEGPVLDADVQDLRTVIWAAYDLYGSDFKIKVEGNAPTLADMGLDEASNYDEDGNPIVR
jgi:hypothetical protein